MTELILYAVPSGLLGEQLARYSKGVDTEAQRYPVHCTLTGFFHDDDVDRYVRAAGEVAAPVDVHIVALRTEADWIGLEVRSPGLLAVTERFAASVADPGSRSDAIRPKSWLHVSLAYGHRMEEHAMLAHRAVTLVDPSAAATWGLHLYQRDLGDRWALLGAWSLERAQVRR